MNHIFVRERDRIKKNTFSEKIIFSGSVPFFSVGKKEEIRKRKAAQNHHLARIIAWLTEAIYGPLRNEVADVRFFLLLEIMQPIQSN